MQALARVFSLYEEALLVFEAHDLNIEQYMRVAAAIQNAIQCYYASYDGQKEKELLPRHLDHFFKRVDRIECSEEP